MIVDSMSRILISLAQAAVKSERTIDYSILENDQALNVAIQGFKNNWNFYIERWNKWHEERK